MIRVAIALGSNLGPRRQSLDLAVLELARVVDIDRVSAFIETAAVGTDPQPDFLNGALVGTTALPAPDLLERMLAILSQQAIAMIIVSHDWEILERLTDRAVVLRNGRLIPAMLHRHPQWSEQVHLHCLDASQDGA